MPLIIAFDPGFNNPRRYALEPSTTPILGNFSRSHSPGRKKRIRERRSVGRIVDEISLTKQEAERKHSEESSYATSRTRINIAYTGAEFAMKVMKANYPSGIVLKQSGLFANIRRRACWSVVFRDCPTIRSRLGFQRFPLHSILLR